MRSTWLLLRLIKRLNSAHAHSHRGHHHRNTLRQKRRSTSKSRSPSHPPPTPTPSHPPHAVGDADGAYDEENDISPT
ncbi:hypothetical protein DFH07DRAFT_377164 [Mycena maculata]|uniref:Uncharacterized protein n=1 Tax=Mycena maculata TaxID=230809 RepID=A0AAD7NKC0_9AGAR|nr:hypothetical protein DFH07DRAFT_377164 [Mycena maculata]